MIDFSLTEEQKMFVQTARRFVQEELQPLEQTIEDTGKLDDAVAKSIFDKAKQAGLFGVNMPQELGGAGLSLLDQCLIEEQFGHTTDILIRRSLGNVYEALNACQGAQIERWLAPAARGDRVVSIAITEPGAGSDAQGIKTRAEKTATGWRLNGGKHFISDALFSDFFLVSAKTGEGDNKNEISMFLVDKGTKGFTIGRDQPMMGLRGTSHCEIWFDNVELADINLLGERGMGFKLAMQVLGQVRLKQIGARGLGKAAHILEMTHTFARERKQFGQPIADFQMIGQMLADSAIEINAARYLVWATAAKVDRGEDARDEIAMVKVHVAEMLGRVVDRCVQIHGGMGFCKDLPIERYYRDARIARIYDGTSEVHRTVVARAMARRGAAVFDPTR